MLLIKLTLKNKMELYLRADLILVVERNITNPLETLVTTAITTQRGAVIYPVLDTPEAISLAVTNAMMSSKAVGLLGMPKH